MLKYGLAAVGVSVASAACADDPSFVAANGLKCSAWAGTDCQRTNAGLSHTALAEVLRNCPVTCNTCIPAADYCDNGIGGDKTTIQVVSETDVLTKFDLIEDELLSEPCEWHASTSGEGLQQVSNAWGNPGDNSLMGCMAIVRGSSYRDFVMSVDITANDNDGVGLVFGYGGLKSRYQVHMMNGAPSSLAGCSVKVSSSFFH